MNSSATRVKVELLNSNGAPIAYVTQGNTMKLRLTNQNGTPVAIKPGTPLQNPPPKGGAFGMALDFSAFFTAPAGQAGLTITAAGWASRYIGGDYPAWILGATQQTTWNDGDALEFTVGNFTPTVPVGTYYLAAEIYNLTSLPPYPSSVLVGVASPPSVQNKNLADVVRLSIDIHEVVITKVGAEPASNRYVLSLLNTNPNSALVPDGVPWGAHPPTFTLGFQYASGPPGELALTTPGAAGNFQVGIRHDPSHGWNVPVKADGPTWVITPRSNVNHGVLGTGTSALVELSIDNVVSQLTPGLTLLYLQYNNVPGYNDGILTLVLTKKYAAMRIASFTAGQTSFPVTARPELRTAYLNWEVENSVLVQLSGVGQVPSKKQAYPVVVEQNEAVVLIAYDPILGTVATARLDLSLDPPLSRSWLPCGSITAWQGATSSIPPGFALCDGTKGTPDLRDRFIMGAGGQQQPRDNGAPTHTHTLSGFAWTGQTSEIPDHRHGVPDWPSLYVYNSGNEGSFGRFGYQETQEAGHHHHELGVSFPAVTSGTQIGGVRPAWYALYYIMLLSPS